MGGFSTKYGQSSSSQKVGAKNKNKKGANKQTWNDGRAPDDISKLVTRKKIQQLWCQSC
jgi:pSer/pThr/pTyr-binding forkhead associated (FHA) protein